MAESKQQKKEILLGMEETNYYTNIVDCHQNLLDLIHSLNQKVEAVIEKHQSEFLNAYQNHIRKINIEMAEIRRKAFQNQKQMKQENKLMILQRQVVLFRDESMKLYDRLEEKTHEAEIYKMKSIELEKTCYITQKEIREVLKSKKNLQLKLSEATGRISQLESQIVQKNEKLQKVSALTSQRNTRDLTSRRFSFRQKSQKKTNMVNKSLLQTKKSCAQNIYDNQLKSWFIQCIKSVKKDVASRKTSSYQFNLDEISSISQFKMVDKLKLLEKFMEHQKLLTWMYQKIFPSRTDEIKEYLSSKKIDRVPFPDSSKDVSLELVDKMESEQAISRQQIELMLPKMKAPKGQIRNKISMRQGKLSLANF